MTVVVGVKIADGIVIAADSAASFSLAPQLGPAAAVQVYNTADKIFHLHRELPIGLATWGGGFMGTGSISSLAKDLRRRLMGLDRDSPTWRLDPTSYTMHGVAELVIEFFYDELFSKTDPNVQPATGLLLVGFSAGRRLGEAWEIALESRSVRPTPEVVFDEGTFGWQVWGQPMAVSRLIEGIGPGLKAQIRSMLTDGRKMIFDSALAKMGGPKVVPAMPLAEAIAFAQFCADTTVGYSRFDPGPATVGGPIDVAAISRHETFRWVRRKHYYSADINPRRPHEHDHFVGRGTDQGLGGGNGHLEPISADGRNTGSEGEGCAPTGELPNRTVG